MGLIRPSSSSASSSETDASRGARDAPVWADQLLRSPDRTTHVDFWKLSQTKRCSQPLADFDSRLLSDRGRKSEAQQHVEARSPHQARLFVYKASPGNLWNFEAVAGRASESWAKTAIVWQSGLFHFDGHTHFASAGRGSAIAESPAMRDVPLFGENEMLIFVGMS